MKKIIRFTLIALVILMSLSLFGCSTINRLLFGGDPYAFSDIVLTQTDLNEYRVEFTANCGKDDVKVYITEGYRLSESAKPLEVDKSVDGKKVRFSFTREFNLGEDYYLWLVYGEKEARTSVTIPSHFPTISVEEDGSAIFNFNYTYGTPWGSFCDPNGKAVYMSNSPVFDSSAVLIEEGIEITVENALIPANMVDVNSYYFAVSTAKDGTVKSISSPVCIYDEIISQVKGISANLTNDLNLKVELSIPESAEISSLVSDCLGLMVKTDVADEIYLADCTYSNGIATLTVDCTNLIYEGLWYDMLLTWRGAVVMDVPKLFNGKQVDGLSSVKVDSVIYAITSWKPDDAPDSAAMLKVYYEKDTTKYADEILRGYIVTFISEPVATLNVTVTLRKGVTEAPVLAITGGDKTMLVSASGVLNEDGTYTYSLPVGEGMTEDDKWYDLRFFVGSTAYEMLKDSCITYDDFSDKYTNTTDARVYEFREWNGLLKLMYTNTVVTE